MSLVPEGYARQIASEAFSDDTPSMLQFARGADVDHALARDVEEEAARLLLQQGVLPPYRREELSKLVRFMRHRRMKLGE